MRAIKGWKNGVPIYGLPKSNKTRTVAPCAEIMELLTTHLSLRSSSPDDLVFTNSERGPTHQVAFLRNHFKPARDLALPDHPNYTFHDLRHVFASVLIAEGVDIKTVSEQLGHASVAFTIATYGHLMPGRHDKVRAAGSSYYNRRSGSNVIHADFGQAS
jgi:integrase